MKPLYKEKAPQTQVKFQNLTTTALLNTGENILVVSEVLQITTSKNQNYQKNTHIKSHQLVELITPIHQCDFMFHLGNKCFTDRFTVLQDPQRNLILGLNWHFNYRIGCKWNVNGQQYTTHDSKIVWSITASSKWNPLYEMQEYFKYY